MTLLACLSGVAFDSSEVKPLLPNPQLSPQQSITAVLSAMKFNSKIGCRLSRKRDAPVFKHELTMKQSLPAFHE
eukprot:762995-Hanusia_phi.AAC.2